MKFEQVTELNGVRVTLLLEVLPEAFEALIESESVALSDEDSASRARAELFRSIRVPHLAQELLLQARDQIFQSLEELVFEVRYQGVRSLRSADGGDDSA